MKPRVGVGILNYNGAQFTIKCLEHLQKLDWPKDRLDIVVVDNGSTDHSLQIIRQSFPDVTVVESSRNKGFAGGTNLAIEALADADYVALLNNDAFVEPGWLEPLVTTLESDPRYGVACPKILFAYSFLDVAILSPLFEAPRPDTRNLGVRVSGLEMGDEDRWHKCQFPSGFYGPEKGIGQESSFRWTNGDAVIRVPLTAGCPEPACRIRVAAERPKRVRITIGDNSAEHEVNEEPRWVDVELTGPPFDVINNAGSDLVESWNSCDRGIWQRDVGQFDEPAEVFAWCGCSALLSRKFIEDVGSLDERFFLYYEDFDLSWRGQAKGWSYAYVPDSVVRHFHTGTTVEHSDQFNFYVQRNHLLVLVKNAPSRVAASALKEFLGQVARELRSELETAFRLRRPRLPKNSLQMLGSLASFLRLFPGIALDRRRIAASATRTIEAPVRGTSL